LTFNKFDEKSGILDTLSNYFSTMYSLVGRFCLLALQAGHIWYFALSLLLLQSCKKHEDDGQSPVIRIETPVTGDTFYFLNTISIRATIQDDRQIESVKLEVTNSQNVRFLETKEFFPADNTFNLNYTITHNDLYLTSGTYYIKISAKDGSTESIVFREIQLIEAPRFLERLFVVRDIGGSTVIDTLHNNSLMSCLNFPQTFLFGGIDSRSQQLVISGNSPSSLLSYSYPDFETINASFPPNNELITSFYHDKEHHCFLWGTQQGNIWRTSVVGTQLFTTVGVSPVLNIGAHSNYIIASSQGSSNNFIYVIRNDNGIIESALPFSWELKGIIDLSADNSRVLLVGNENSAAHFTWLNLTTASFNEVFNFYESSPVQSVCSGSENDFYAVHENGLAHYSNSMDNYTINADLIPDKLIYDDLENILFAVNQNELKVLDEQGLSTLQTIAAPGITDVWLKYNK
jgi:hypothetical protein